MFWILFAVAVSAGLLSPTVGIAAALLAASAYAGLRLARKGGRIETVRVLLLLLSPLIGLLAGAVLFLAGPGF